MQWLVTADQQSRLRPYFKGELTSYGTDTVLRECAYTLKRFRGAGIMGAAMAEIAEPECLRLARPCGAWLLESLALHAPTSPSLSGEEGRARVAYRYNRACENFSNGSF